MAEKTMVTIGFQDSYGKRTRRGYMSRDADPTDAVVQALAQAAQDISALSVVYATVTRDVDVSGITEAAEAKASRQKDASITYTKSALRNSHPGPFTFNITEPKAALLNPNGSVDLANGLWDSWREKFDDGAGIAGVVGTFYISDGEELIEDEEPLDGFLNKR